MGGLNKIFKKKNALVIGIGGGGDVVSTLPVMRYLKSMDIDSIVGGVAWQWAWTIDSKPGPRSLNEIKNCEKISETVAIVNPKTTIQGTKSEYPEIIVSKLYNLKVILVDITKGPLGVVSGLRNASTRLGYDIFVGVDAGGDVLETGKERGIRSPEADSIMLAAMTKLETPSILAVMGLGLDGELTLQELKKNISKTLQHGGYFGSRRLTTEDFQDYEKCIENGVKTGVGSLILDAAKGRNNKAFLNSDILYPVEISSFVLRAFFFDPKIVFNYVNAISRRIEKVTNFEEINQIISQLGIKTMYDREKDYLAKISKINLHDS